MVSAIMSLDIIGAVQEKSG